MTADVDGPTDATVAGPDDDGVGDGEDANPMEPATTAGGDGTTGDADGAGSAPGFGVATAVVVVLATAAAARRRTA